LVVSDKSTICHGILDSSNRKLLSHTLYLEETWVSLDLDGLEAHMFHVLADLLRNFFEDFFR
jgi:hypothetical protein